MEQQIIQQQQRNRKIRKKAKTIKMLITSSQVLETKSQLRIPSFDSLENSDSYLSRIPTVCSCEKILLVDDSEIIRMILSQILEDNNYTFKAAVNGKEAVDLVKQKLRSKCCKQFQVIIMDCEMPVLNGWEATRSMRQIGYQGTIIGYTAYANEQDVERCLNAGMNKVLFKPSKSQDILKEIKKYDY